MMKYISVAIDGPSGAGKSTVARAAAAKLGYVYVDTGAMYRSIGLAVCRRGIAGENTAGIIATLPEITIQLTYQDGAQRVLLNGEDVSEAIRTPEISYYASKVSAVPEVRRFLLETQRNMAKNSSILMDGRDIGTVILPDAPVKIFLTASAQSRAERRYKELIEKGQQVHPARYQRARQAGHDESRCAAQTGGRCGSAGYEQPDARGEHSGRSAYYS